MSMTDAVQNQLPPHESRKQQTKAMENTTQLSGATPVAMSTRSSSRKNL